MKIKDAGARWGGFRMGAGRPAIPDRVVKVVKMPASYVHKVNFYARVSGIGSFSGVIRRLIEQLPEEEVGSDVVDGSENPEKK